MNIRLGKNRSETGLAATLAMAFFILSVVVLVISNGFQVYSNIRAQQETLASKQQLIAHDAANEVSNFIQKQLGVLETSARLTEPTSASQEIQLGILNSLLGQQPAFRQMALLDAQNTLLAHTSRLSQQASGNITERLSTDAMTQIRLGESYISPVYIDQNTSEPMVVMAVPIKNVFGDTQGTLLAEVNLKFMWDLMDQVQVGETGYAYVVDQKGELLAYKDTGRVLQGENLNRIAEVGKFIANPSGQAGGQIESYTGINGAWVVGTFIPLGTPSWAVLTEVPWQEANAPVVQGLIVSVVTALVMAVVAGLVGVYLARGLSKPIISLAETANRISAGELKLQADVAGPKEVGSLAVAFNKMTAELRQLLNSQEQRVIERTRALAVSAEVSRRLSTILEPDQLVHEVVNQLRQAFNFYHVHIYLFDEKQENLVMAGGTGKAGQAMLAKRHRILKGRGLVGRAADLGQAVLVGDVTKSEGWLPNPLLPDTKAEVAVPIAVGEMVLGVLDVQQNSVDGLGQSDAELIQAIANQVAIALQNARTYAAVQRQADREALIAAIGQRIQHTTTSEEALLVAVREIGRAVGTDAVVHLKNHPDNGNKRSN